MGITVLTKLLPIFAVKACEDLKSLLPTLLLVLARIVCWETRQPETLQSPPSLAGRGRHADVLIEPTIDDPQDHIKLDTGSRLPVRSDLQWERLEQTFVSASSAPPLQQYFAFLYYLFPCNTLRFMRGPALYLSKLGLESLYTVSWEDALDEDKIRSKSEVCLSLFFRIHVHQF